MKFIFIKDQIKKQGSCEINKFFSCHVSLPCFLILLIIPHCPFIRKGDDLTLYGCVKSQNMINFMWIK